MTTKILLVCFVIIFTPQLTQGSIGGFICPYSSQKFLGIATAALASPQSTSSAYYGANIYELLSTPVPLKWKELVCQQLPTTLSGSGLDIDTLFFGLKAQKLLGCEGKLPKERIIKEAQTILQSDKSTVTNLHYATAILISLGHQVSNAAKIAQLAQAQLKTDDSVVTLGHALHLAALLGDFGKFITERIEDIVVQADEIDGKLLQWEGGLSTTSLVVTGLLKFPTVNALNQIQADKVANYLLSRVTVQTPRGVSALLEAAAALSNSNIKPVSISIAGSASVTEKNPILRLQVSDIFGRALKPAPSLVLAQSATRIADDVVVLAKQQLTPGTKNTEFVLPLKLEPGFYKILFNVFPHSTTVNVRVLGSVEVENFEIGLSDNDGSSAPRLETLVYPNILKTKLQGDSGQKLLVKFTLSRSVHQAFVRLAAGKKEIIFVAGRESNNHYKVEADLEQLKVSDTFNIELIVGDSIVSNPFIWTLGKIEVKSSSAPAIAGIKTVRGPKPEIRHMFRQPDKRPPKAVSLLFTALTASPFLILLILWGKIGVNLSNFTARAIPFHLGFGGILALFTLFWLKLDMFTTCAWVIPIGGFTFFAGHRLLSSIARSKKAEK